MIQAEVEEEILIRAEMSSFKVLQRLHSGQIKRSVLF